MADGRWTILVVDDEEAVLSLMVAALQTQGYAVRGAGGCDEAAELLKKERFDLLLTDMNMPRQDGLQLIEETKALKPTMPVIAMSADPDEWRIQLQDIPCLSKPFPFHVLYGEVQRLLEKNT